ncbi:MAG TPA: hypothetical protein PK528_13115, partial [Syntrophorhabdus sp.]|nr:hypothetical protein [Syntrophorhabdus sp.]
SDDIRLILFHVNSFRDNSDIEINVVNFTCLVSKNQDIIRNDNIPLLIAFLYITKLRFQNSSDI